MFSESPTCALYCLQTSEQITSEHLLKIKETSTPTEETSTGTGAQSEATTTEEDSPGSRQTGSLGMVGMMAGVVVAGLY